MKRTDTKIDFSSISVEKTIASLECLLGNAVEKGLAMKSVPAAMLWGPPGVGKSQGICQLAQRLTDKHGVRVVVTDVRLLLYNPIDLRGMPTVNAEKTLAVWLKPQVLDMEQGEDIVNILFLDELTAAPQAVQAAAYQICLDRQVGEHKLPDNCYVVAAGNRTTDRSVSYSMPKALCNRLIHINVSADFRSWKRWAESNSISQLIINYLEQDRSNFFVEGGPSDIAYPTPRSWEYVSRILEITGCQPKDVHHLIAGAVGKVAATEFEAFCKGFMNDIPCVQEIFSGSCRATVKGYDAMNLMCSSIIKALRTEPELARVDKLNNMWEYVTTLFPKDMLTSFVKELLELEGMESLLMKCYSFEKWWSTAHRR